MLFTNQELRELIAGKAVGNSFPYDSKDEEMIEAHIKRLYHRINRIPNVICEAEWNHFGSGYASYVEVFCYRKEDVSVVCEKNGQRDIEIRGVLLDVCRLAPVAIMGEDERYRSIRMKTNEELTGGFGTLLDGPRRLYVSEKLHPLAEELKRVLKEYDYELLDAESVNSPLSFQTTIPTIFREPGKYIVMDAIFYWED